MSRICSVGSFTTPPRGLTWTATIRRASLLVLVLTAVLAGPPSSVRASLLDDLVFAHDFDYVVGNTIDSLHGPDAIKSGAPMTVGTTNTLPFSTQQLVAPSHSGTRPVVNTASQLMAPVTNLSFSLFYNAQGSAGNTAGTPLGARLLSTYPGGGPLSADQLLFDTLQANGTVTDRSLRFIVGNVVVQSTALIPSKDSAWHHVGVVFEGGNAGPNASTATFYHNGVQLGSSVEMNGINAVPAQARAWNLVEDHDGTGTNNNEYFSNGYYDEAALWHRALSPAEMQSVYQTGLRAAIAQPVPASDQSIYHHDFEGSGNLTPGPGIAQVAGVITLANSFATTASNQSTANFLRTSTLDFSQSPDDWLATVRFRVDGTFNTESTRQFHLLSGSNTPFAPDNDVWEVLGIDLRLRETASDPNGTGSTFDLTWFGWDNVNDSRIAQAVVRGTNLDKGTLYELTAHRKPDGMVDIYLDGLLIDTKPLIIGSGAQGGNPERLQFGDMSNSITASVSIDYLSVGVLQSAIVPEPSTWILLSLGLAGLLFHSRRRLLARNGGAFGS